MAAHHAAQRQHQSSIPPPPPPSNVFNDELRLPSIKDLQFKYERPRQESPQNTGSGPQSASEFSVSSSQERSRVHPQSWGRPPHPIPPAPTVISTHHPQQQHTPPLSAGHESKSAEYPTRHDSGGYLTPGMPLSAQTTPLPGSVSTGPGIRNDSHSQLQNKRSRASSLTPVASRDSRPNHVVYPYQPYQAAMPPPSPYHQINPAPPPPSPHTHMQHPPSAAPAHPSYSYQQQQQPYIPRSSPQHISPHALSSQPYHSAPSQHPSQHTQQLQAPPPHPSQSQPPQPHHNVSYPSPTPSVSQEHWEHHHHQPHSQHAQPVHSVQHHPVQHVPPPPPTATIHQYSHPPPPPPPMTPLSNHPQPPPPLQPPPLHHQHATYAQSVNPHPSHTLARAVQPVIATSIVHTPEVDPYIADTAKSSTRQSTMSEIVKLCSILYDFASRYSSLSSALPHVHPSQTEVAEMARRANDVARLLEVLRRMDEPETKHNVTEEMATTPDDRPPKRPWEDMAQDGQAQGDERAGMFPESPLASSAATGQTTAEQDMELIRSKRATTTAGAAAATGQPKSKYRKRSRATPPGKCHSCNIRETPEWRRGPDGARTLCNACGLHYAKLMRKQSKLSANSNGEPPPKIDLDTLKASTKAAETEKGGKPDESNSVPSGPPQHHQGSFQVISVVSPIEAQGSPASDPSRLPAHHQTILPPPANSAPPPPPWAANVTRPYAPSDQFQSQSFMRTVNTR